MLLNVLQPCNTVFISCVQSKQVEVFAEGVCVGNQGWEQGKLHYFTLCNLV